MFHLLLPPPPGQPPPHLALLLLSPELEPMPGRGSLPSCSVPDFSCFCFRLVSTRFCAAVKKAMSTFAAVLADVEMKKAPIAVAFACPSASLTQIWSVMSLLFAIKILIVVGPHS